MEIDSFGLFEYRAARRPRERHYQEHDLAGHTGAGRTPRADRAAMPPHGPHGIRCLCDQPGHASWCAARAPDSSSLCQVAFVTGPQREEHEERLEWLGLDSADQFDPAAFDAAQVDSALSALATVLVKNRPATCHCRQPDRDRRQPQTLARSMRRCTRPRLMWTLARRVLVLLACRRAERHSASIPSGRVRRSVQRLL